jgi:hypothetical protein
MRLTLRLGDGHGNGDEAGEDGETHIEVTEGLCMWYGMSDWFLCLTLERYLSCL